MISKDVYDHLDNKKLYNTSHPHLFKNIFEICISDLQKKILNFGLLLKKNLLALDFRHFIGNNTTWRGLLEGEEGRSLASFQLVPSIIMAYCRDSIEKKNILDIKEIGDLIESPFSRIQLNAQNLASKNFIKVLVTGNVPSIDYTKVLSPLVFMNFDIDWFQYRADTPKYMRNSTKLYMALKQLLDSVNNRKKVLNRATDDI